MAKYSDKREEFDVKPDKKAPFGIQMSFFGSD